jgi:hypothetical protein
MNESTTSTGPVKLVGRPRANTDDVVAALADVLSEREEFLILERTDEQFMQAIPNVVEYREGDQQYRFAGSGCDRATMERLLLSYFTDDERWRTMVPWENVTAELAQQSARVNWWNGLVTLVALAGGAAGLLWWFRAR